MYDAGFSYSDGLPANPTAGTQKRKVVATLSPSLSRLNPSQLIALADLVGPKTAPVAPATPPLPNLSAKAAGLIAKRDAAKTANDAYESAKAALVSLKAARDAAADDLRDEHKVVVSAIEAEARGDDTLLSATGYPLAASAVPATLPAAISNLSVTAGDIDGTLDVTFDPEANSKTYEVQITTTDPVAGPWTTKAQPTTSSTSINGLTSGQRV